MKEDNCITASNLIYIKAKRIISTKNVFLLDIYSALLHSFPSTLAAALTGPAVARLLYGTAREQIEWFVRQCLSSTPASFPAALTARLFSRPSGFNITPCHSGRPALRLAASCGGGERRDPGSSAGLRARKRRARPCRSGRDAAAPACYSAQRANSSARDGRTSPRSAANAPPVSPPAFLQSRRRNHRPGFTSALAGLSRSSTPQTRTEPTARCPAVTSPALAVDAGSAARPPTCSRYAAKVSLERSVGLRQEREEHTTSPGLRARTDKQRTRCRAILVPKKGENR